jgi:hypothetical protein
MQQLQPSSMEATLKPKISKFMHFSTLSIMEQVDTTTHYMPQPAVHTTTSTIIATIKTHRSPLKLPFWQITSGHALDTKHNREA